jgi:recombinational DNA repair protein RecR
VKRKISKLGQLKNIKKTDLKLRRLKRKLKAGRLKEVLLKIKEIVRARKNRENIEFRKLTCSGT